MTEPRRDGKRPFGLYAITMLLLINAVMIALDASHSYVSIGVDLGLPRMAQELQNLDVDRLARYLISGVHVAVAIGLWTYRRWAWAALMIVVGVALAEGLLLYARHEPRFLNMLFNVLIVFYLNQREVRGLFPRSDATPAAV